MGFPEAGPNTGCGEELLEEIHRSVLSIRMFRYLTCRCTHRALAPFEGALYSPVINIVIPVLDSDWLSDRVMLRL